MSGSGMRTGVEEVTEVGPKVSGDDSPAGTTGHATQGRNAVPFAFAPKLLAAIPRSVVRVIQMKVTFGGFQRMKREIL